VTLFIGSHKADYIVALWIVAKLLGPVNLSQMIVRSEQKLIPSIDTVSQASKNQ